VSVFGIMPGATEPLDAGNASLPSGAEVPAGAEAPPPIGWVDFGARYRGECEDRDLPAAIIALKSEDWTQLRSVNELVNRIVEPVSDLIHWNVPERWDYPSDGKGDCEDYVLLKRKLLIEHGYPRQALLITVVFLPEDNDGHAVLMVKTKTGDLILDNRRTSILRWDDTGYEFIKRQSQENQTRWVLLTSPGPPPVEVSAQSSGNR
jgi:predicted transglutaminase-like cysteine proteinase